MKKEYSKQEIEALVLESLGESADDEEEEGTSQETPVIRQTNQKPKTVKRPGKKN